MALFKISKGLKANLPSAKTAGYCWYTIDDSLFYIDYEDENGEVQRKALNAKDAETLTGASLATILNSSDVEIPTSAAVLTALDDRIKKVTLSDGNIHIFEYESGIYQFVSENASGTLRIWGKSGTGDTAAAEFQEILAYSTVAAFINKAVSDTTTVWHFSHVNDSTSFYDVSYNSDTDTWTTIYSSELEQYVSKNQGTSNSGKVMTVGDDGVVTPAANIVYVGPDMPTDQNIKVWINTSEEGTGVIPVIPRVATITLSKSAWTGSANPYSQVVDIATVTASTKIDLQPTAQQIISLQNEDIALIAQNDNGAVTIYALGGKPSVDYVMQVLLTEVAYV